MSFVESFGPDMVQEAARGVATHWFANEDGDVVLRFFGDEVGMPLHVELAAEGQDRHLYVVRVQPGRYFAPDDWPRLVGLINEYHCKYRSPRICLAHLPNGTWAQLNCEGHLDLRVGIHQALLTDFTSHVISTTISFLEWLNEQVPRPPTLIDARDPDQLQLDLRADRTSEAP